MDEKTIDLGDLKNFCTLTPVRCANFSEAARKNNQCHMNEDVKKCNELHEMAMSFADQAYGAEKKGKPEEAKAHYAKAYETEKKSALILLDKYDIEPSRSVLFRSAAWLAIKAGKFREAEKMAAFGLSGNPPHPVDKELREVFDHILEHFKSVAVA